MNERKPQHDIETITNQTMTQDMLDVISTTLSLLRMTNPNVIYLYKQMRGNLRDPDYKELYSEKLSVKEYRAIETKAAIFPGFRSTYKAQTLADLNARKRERVEALLSAKTAQGMKEIALTNENYPELHSSRNGVFVECERWGPGIRAFDVNDDFLVSGLSIPQKLRPGMNRNDAEELLAYREFWVQEMRRKSSAVLRALK